MPSTSEEIRNMMLSTDHRVFEPYAMPIPEIPIRIEKGPSAKITKPTQPYTGPTLEEWRKLEPDAFTKPPRQRNAQPEANLQKACIKYAKLQHPQLLIHHSPNEGARHFLVGQNNRAKGTITGYPDLAIHGPGGRMMFVEMKAGKGALTDKQQQVIDHLRALGFPVCVVNSFEVFKAAVDTFARGENPKTELFG